jgi:hypothetical protein
MSMEKAATRLPCEDASHMKAEQTTKALSEG